MTHRASLRQAFCGLRIADCGLSLLFILALALPVLAASSGREEYELSVAWRAFVRSDTRPLIGVALGGGGGRGMAHIGVLRALENTGIPVERISGASIGSFVGSLYASGAPVDRIEALAVGTNWSNLVELKLSRMGVYSTSRLERFINFNLSYLQSDTALLARRRKFEESADAEPSDITFSDLKIPFACTATDLFAGTTVIYDSGPVAEAVRASCSIPGLFEPITVNGRLMVDGGVLANLPVSLCRQLGAARVIAVDVESDTPEQLNGLIEILMQIVKIQGRALTAAERASADYIVAPAVGSVKSTDLRRSAYVIQEGEAAGWRAASGIKRRLLGRPDAADEGETVSAEARRALALAATPSQTATGYPRADLTAAVTAALALARYRQVLELTAGIPTARRTDTVAFCAAYAALRLRRTDLIDTCVAAALAAHPSANDLWRLAAAAVDAGEERWEREIAARLERLPAPVEP